MSYIKFVLQRQSDDDGNTVKSVISRIESDMPGSDTLETNIIMRALAHCGKVEKITYMILNSGRLDNDILT